MVAPCIKLTFKTKSDAAEALKVSKYREHQFRCVKAYKCIECGLWHLTSQNQEYNTARNKRIMQSKKDKKRDKYKDYKRRF